MNSHQNKINLKAIIITSIITAIFTVTTQYFLQNNQLANEQDYWKKRFNIENVQTINNVRVKLIEEISEGILQLEVQAKEIKILKASVKYSNSESDLKDLNQLLIKYHKDLYKVAAKMEIATIYFDKDVSDQLQILGKTITENFQNNLVGISDRNIDFPELNLDFETIDKLPQVKKQTFELMLQKIHKDLNQQF